MNDDHRGETKGEGGVYHSEEEAMVKQQRALCGRPQGSVRAWCMWSRKSGVCKKEKAQVSRMRGGL